MLNTITWLGAGCAQFWFKMGSFLLILLFRTCYVHYRFSVGKYVLYVKAVNSCLTKTTERSTTLSWDCACINLVMQEICKYGFSSRLEWSWSVLHCWNLQVLEHRTHAKNTCSIKWVSLWQSKALIFNGSHLQFQSSNVQPSA